MKQALLDASTALNVTVPDLGTGKTFEALALFTCANLMARYSDVEVRGPDCLPTKIFILRGGPGHISKRSAKSGPSHILLKPDEPIPACELHNSLEFIGVSGSEHEIDVAMVAHVDAERARSRGHGPMQDAPYIAIELKEYSASETLDKNTTRAFLASCIDLAPLRHVEGIAPETVITLGTHLKDGTSHRRKEIKDYYPDTLTLFLTTAGISDKARQLGSFYGIVSHTAVTPEKLREALDKIIYQYLFPLVEGD